MKKKIIQSNIISENSLVVHEVDIAHYRLIQLSSLADQEKPFYEWFERQAERIFHTNNSLHVILKTRNESEIKRLISEVMYYSIDDENVPFLVDGGGRPYEHKKAVFFFFAWLIRDAPQQRLAPLITRMRKLDKSMDAKTTDLQIESLAKLIVKYRDVVKSFEWNNVRDVLINRLEGSRRSLKGHILEAYVRSAVSSAIQTYYKSHLNYGGYRVKLESKQVKINNDTMDVTIDLENDDTAFHIYFPVKSRETEGGGHAHLFSRDIMTAINNVKQAEPDSKFVVVIVAENWDEKELETISDSIDMILHFRMNPNEFQGFDEQAQIALNEYIAEVFDGKQ